MEEKDVDSNDEDVPKPNIPKLKIKKVEQEQDQDDTQNDNKQQEKDLTFERHFNEIDLKLNEKNGLEPKIAKFLYQLYDLFPPFAPFEMIVKVLLFFQILSLILSPYNYNFGAVGRVVLQIHTYVFLGGAASNTLFHSSFFIGSFLTILLLSFTIIAYTNAKAKNAIAFLGLTLNVFQCLYIPSLIGSLSVIFKLYQAQWTYEDAYIYVFGVIGILQSLILFIFMMFFTMSYYEWKPETLREKNLMGRPHNRFEILFLFGLSIMCIFYHFTVLLDYLVVSVNMIVITISLIIFLHYLPYYNNHINRLFLIPLIQLWLATIIVFFMTIFNRETKSEIPLYIYLACIFISIPLGIILPTLRTLYCWRRIAKKKIRYYQRPFYLFIDFEVSIKHIETEKEILQTYELYQQFQRSENSSLFFLCFFNFLFFKLRSPAKALTILDTLSKSWMILDMYLLFLIKREFVRENINYYPTEFTQGYALNRAKQAEEEAKKLHLMFWYLLSAYGELTQFFKPEDYIPNIISKIKEIETKTLTLYSKVIMESQNPSIHHSYAQFCENVLGDLETAEIHRIYAKNLNDDEDYDQDTHIANNDDNNGNETPKIIEKKDDQHIEKEETDSDIDNRYGLNIDEQGNTKHKSEKKLMKIKEGNNDIELEDIKEVEGEDEEGEEEHIKEIQIQIPKERINLRENDYGTPLENSKLEDVPIESDGKKPTIPKLNFKSSLKDGIKEKINSKPLETFRADILIPNDDELSLISGLSENDVIEEQNIIGSNEKTTFKILRGKINEKMTVKNCNSCILISYFLAVLFLIICFILVFVDLGIFSVQIVPILSAGAINTYSQNVFTDTLKTLNVISNQGNFTQSLINLKNFSDSLRRAKDQSYNYIYDYQRTCTFTCNYYSNSYQLWNSPSILSKNYFGNNILEESMSLKDFTNSFVEASSNLLTTTPNTFGNNTSFQFIAQNIDQNITSLLQMIQDNYIKINYGKIGLVLLISLISLFFLIISCLPFLILYRDSNQSRKKALNLYSVIKSQKLSPEIYSSLKAKDMIKPDIIKQKAATFFAEKSYQKSFLKRHGLCYSLIITIISLISIFLIILACMWCVYSLYFYMYSFMISDIKCSEERNFYSAKITLITQQLQNGNTQYSINDIKTQIDNLNEIQRAILQGNSTVFQCVKSEGRYSAQNILLNNRKCTNTTIECMSLNSLLQYYTLVGYSIQTVNDSAFLELQRIEPVLTYNLIESQNLYIQEGSYYSDIMFNVLMYVFSLSLPVFLLILFDIILPYLEKLKIENEVSERMFSLIPLKFLTSNQKVRDYFNREVFEQMTEVNEYKQEAEFYMKILLSSSQPIILFSNESEGQILIYNMNDIAKMLFECQEEMKDLPLVTLFPNQLQIIRRFITSSKSKEDKNLFPSEIPIKGRSSSGKILNLIASFHEITDDVCVMHLKEEITITKELLADKEKSIQTLKYDNIPSEYMYRIIKGERIIFETFHEITIICIEFIKLDKYISKSKDEDIKRILSLYINLIETLAQNYDLIQLNSYGRTFILSNDVFDTQTKEQTIKNAIQFGQKCFLLLEEINQKLESPIELSISIHNGPGIVAIRPCNRGSKSRYTVEIYGDVILSCESLCKIAPKNYVCVSSSVYDLFNKSFKFEIKDGSYVVQNNQSTIKLPNNEEDHHKKDDDVLEL